MTGQSDQENDLDALLNLVEAPAASEDVKQRILTDHARVTLRNGHVAERFLARLKKRPVLPAGLLAGLSAIGFVTGMASAAAGDVYAPEEDVWFYADEAIDAAFVESEEEESWAVE